MKIGDFGLATRELTQMSVADSKGRANSSIVQDKQRAHHPTKTPGLTKHIGTSLYLAPELGGNPEISTKFYTSKIDVYRFYILNYMFLHLKLIWFI